MVIDVTKNIKKCGAIFFTAAFLIWLCIGTCLSPVLAAGNGRGEIQLTCAVEGKPLVGMTWRIYKVGELDPQSRSTRFNAYAPFDNYFVHISDMSATNLTDMASTLENLAVLDKVEPLKTDFSSENGEVVFDDLEPGLYLLSGKYFKSEDGLHSYRPAPTLVEITSAGELIHIDAKVTHMLTLAGEITAHTVKKIWENDIQEIRPKSVTAEIYRDGELVETVELNEENNWTYRWNTDIYADWRVREKDYFDKYTVVYRNNDVNMGDNQYAIINTFDEDGDNVVPKTTTTPNGSTVTTTTTSVRTGPIGGDDATRTSSRSPVEATDDGPDKTTNTSANTTKTTTVTTTENKLPQTGQLWWPVPVFAFGGLIFVAVGVRLRARNKE